MGEQRSTYLTQRSGQLQPLTPTIAKKRRSTAHCCWESETLSAGCCYIRLLLHGDATSTAGMTWQQANIHLP